MKSPVLALAVFLLVSIAQASDNYLISLPNNGPQTQVALKGFPGYYWGAAADKIYLAGGQNVIDWLDYYNITYQAVPFDDETSTLYLCYVTSQNNLAVGETVASGQGYVITKRPAGNVVSYQTLCLRSMPRDGITFPGDEILTYNSRVDTLMRRVNQDSIISFLNRLSGNASIQINGGLDTIHTRYSSTTDNILAAQYLKETLQRYGYQVEYHKFYNGTARHVASFGANRAWLVTETSEALRTTDGGGTWVTMPDNTPNTLWGVENAGPDSVWISGNIGTIKFSADGGQNFTTQISGTTGYLFGIDFINSTTGWIAADTGVVLYTTNSGWNWIRQVTPSVARLYDICFVDSAYGWAVGRDGAIVHTTDGGANWSLQSSNVLARLYGVVFTDRNVGWIAGWSGVVLHTIDGGANWMPVNLWTSADLYHVAFTDSLHGCIVGLGGKIFTTSDAGVTWTPIPARASWNLYGLTYVDSLVGYAVGDRTVIKTTDGGSSWVSQAGNIDTDWLNVIATKPGTTQPGQQVILCAHYDDTSEMPSSRAPGSDDNGSGATAVIEAGRIFARTDFRKTVKLCLWSGEEQGLRGSAAYASDAADRGDTIVGVINFDMLAWDGNGDDSIEIHVGNLASSLALSNTFDSVLINYAVPLNREKLTWNANRSSDHASFWDNNFPAIMGIEDHSGDFNPYYHTTNDNMTHIDSTFFKNFVKAGVGAVATLAIIDPTNEGVSEDGVMPLEFTLNQNYPNPFNATTLISFNLFNKADIDLSIYDLLGRKVATLISGPIEAGAHAITWNAGSFASGIYLCRLHAAGHDSAMRMLLVK
jgi:photosystem II stability/assembly factor-like uncharacterized protein